MGSITNHESRSLVNSGGDNERAQRQPHAGGRGSCNHHRWGKIFDCDDIKIFAPPMLRGAAEVPARPPELQPGGAGPRAAPRTHQRHRRHRGQSHTGLTSSTFTSIKRQDVTMLSRQVEVQFMCRVAVHECGNFYSIVWYVVTRYVPFAFNYNPGVYS